MVQERVNLTVSGRRTPRCKISCKKPSLKFLLPCLHLGKLLRFILAVLGFSGQNLVEKGLNLKFPVQVQLGKMCSLDFVLLPYLYLSRVSCPVFFLSKKGIFWLLYIPRSFSLGRRPGSCLVFWVQKFQTILPCLFWQLFGLLRYLADWH